MKFPGKRKNKHYFPVTEKGRESADPHFLQTEPFYPPKKEAGTFLMF
jgi:hypothetical protein